jgi:hypothetical protein
MSSVHVHEFLAFLKEVGLDRRSVKRYLSSDTPAGPPRAPSRRGTVARKIDALALVVDAWLATDPRLKVWVPETPHTSRDLLILVDEPAEAVVSFDLVDLGCCATGEWS